MLYPVGDMTRLVIVEVITDVALAVVGVNVYLDIVSVILGYIVVTDVNAVIPSCLTDGVFDGVGRRFKVTHLVSPFFNYHRLFF